MLKKFHHIVLNFLVVNLCLLLPAIFVLMYRAPMNYEVELFCAEGVHSVKVGHIPTGDDQGKVEYIKTLKGSCNGSQYSFRDYFAESDPVQMAVLYFSAPAGARLGIKRILITQYDFYTQVLTAEELNRSYFLENGGAVDFNNGCLSFTVPPSGKCVLRPNFNVMPRWSGGKFSLTYRYWPHYVIEALEIFALLFSIFAALFIDTKTSIKRSAVLSVATAFVLALQVIYVIPLQTYLPNRIDFPFGISELTTSLIPSFLGLFALVSAILFVCQYRFGYAIHFVFWGLMAYEYLLTGLLSAGEPPFNGTFHYYMQPNVVIRDAVVLASIALALTLSYHWLKRYYGYLLLGLSIMILASMADVKCDKREKKRNTRCVFDGECGPEHSLLHGA